MSFWKDLSQPIVGLAPMDGITDAAFRLITTRHGPPDVSFTEFTPVERIINGRDPDISDLRFSETERPIVAQLFGSKPESFYKAAHVVCELGFDGIDINMGCPARSIAGKGAGAGLIQTPELARQILRRTKDGVRDWTAGQDLKQAGFPAVMVEAVNCQRVSTADGLEKGNYQIGNKEIPVSVKTRLGYNDIVIEDWIETLLRESPAVITVHGRTLKQRYSGEADWDLIARATEIVRKTKTLILGNGDIQSAAVAVQRIRHTEVHGVLLGRVTLGNPWIFKTTDAIRRSVREGASPPADPSVSVKERLSVTLEHAELFYTLKGRHSYRSIRKFLAAYCRYFPNGDLLQRELVHTDTLSQVESVIRSFVLQNPQINSDAKPLFGHDVCV